jgi:hypothetical protein
MPLKIAGVKAISCDKPDPFITWFCRVIEEFAVTKMIAVESVAKDSFALQIYTYKRLGLFFRKFIC